MGINSKDYKEDRERPWIASFGRRRGRKFSTHRQALLEDALKQHRLTLPPAGELYPIEQETWIEIGFGGGEHLAAQAKQHPNIQFIGCEPYLNGVASLLGHMEEQQIDNIQILTDDARLLLESLPESSIDRVFILYPDPWPKARHHNRRIISNATLDMLVQIMKPGATLRIATDHDDYATWIMAHLLDHPNIEWHPITKADWQTPPEDWVETRYEQKAKKSGKTQMVYINANIAKSK